MMMQHLVDMGMSVDPVQPGNPAMLGSSLLPVFLIFIFDGPCATTQIGLINGSML